MHDVAVLEAARRSLALTVMDLWIAYFALGGMRDAHRLGSYLRGQDGTTDSDHDVIVHALNEMFSDRGQDSPIPYSKD